MSGRSKFEIARAILVARGGTPKPADSFHNFLEKWLVQEGGTPKPCDSQNDLLRKLCVARGVTPLPIDSNNDLLRHMSGLGVGCMNTEHLEAILNLIESDESEPPAPQIPPPAVLSDFGPGSNGIDTMGFQWTDEQDYETGFELWGRDVTAAQAFTLQQTTAANAGIITGHLHIKAVGLPGFTNLHNYEYFIRTLAPDGNTDSNVLAFQFAIA